METGLVAADDLMPIILWTNLFLEAQSYGSTNMILYQDNQSAILLERNGWKSSGRSPTSSRNSVPLFAERMMPGLSALAPVNEPFL